MRVTGPSPHVAGAPTCVQAVTPGAFAPPRAPGRGVEACAESLLRRAGSALVARHPRDPGRAGSEGAR